MVWRKFEVEKYEYKVIWRNTTDSESLQYALNLYGEYGWQLGHIDEHRIVLQRQKAEEEDHDV